MQKQKIQERGAAGRIETFMWILFAAALMVFCFSIHVKAADGVSAVEKVQLINDRDIEIYWSEEVTGAGWVDSRRVGSELVRQEQNYTVAVEKYEPFYTQVRTLDCGVKVLGSAKVREAAMDKAKEMLEVLLANETVANRMGDAGCMMGLYGEGEIGYDIPEHRFDFDVNYLYVEGFGGTQLASICDANVLRLNTGSYQTNYPNESILTHEFAHTVYNFGLSEAQQQEWIDIYNDSTSSGKWANSYAGSNKDEYFATLSAIWFNVMDDTTDGTWDGVRGPINTRTELKTYDRAAYDFT